MATQIKTKTDAFIEGMNKALSAYREELMRSDKSGTKKYSVFTIQHNNNKSTYQRSAKQHAAALVNNRSWTFLSRHLSESARHVLVYKDGSLTFQINNASDWAPYDFQKIKDLWATEMAKQGLRNYKGKNGWGEGDILHLELPDSAPSLHHPVVKQVIKLYVHATRVNGKAKNKRLEAVPKFKRVIEKYEKMLKQKK